MATTLEARREPVGFVLPEPTATLDLTMDDGAPIRVVRHGNLSGPRVVLSHGAGFASDSYFPFWRLMLERFDLALFDFRNCGRNPFHAGETHYYSQFARDSAAVHCAITGEWGEKTTIGVFHSMSAITALLAVVEGGLALGSAGAVRPADGAAGRQSAARPEDNRGRGAARRLPDSPEPVPEPRGAG